MTRQRTLLVNRRAFLRGSISLAFGAASVGGVRRAGAADALPTLWLIGDSTVKNGTAGQQGWGDPLTAFFDPTKIKVTNRARGGRSSRTYFTEGLWDAVLAQIKPGDYVLMQFGHNDGGALSDPRGRASIKGNGDETQEATSADGVKKEMVHSYGWYLRRYITDTKAKGATPIVLSLVPRNIWQGDKVARGVKSYETWAAEAAKQGGAAFVNLNEVVARRYEALGHDKAAALFTSADHTHTNPDGAKINAECVVSGLKTLPDAGLIAALSALGRAVVPAPIALVASASSPVPAAAKE